MNGTDYLLEDIYVDKMKSDGDGIIHLVPAHRIDRGNRIAYCGFDTTGRSFKPENSANCVVCIEMSEKSNHDRMAWLRERDEWLDSLH